MHQRKRSHLIFFDEFKKKWDKDFPSAVKSLENSIDSCLTFYSFPEQEWISLRTTNVIERLNKEFKRRTKPMEIVGRRKILLPLIGFCSFKDGATLEIESYR